ncbi:phosphoglycerate mutase-like protein [Aureobasidium namibiae CBS 147.97]|uniref:Phosphoglycerate mutase-like protein n=1 Tax=Aureobasidium namibiae CBS 147.97 TaxID=1043004 RepID=A0A074X8C7_9PEZI
MLSNSLVALSLLSSAVSAETVLGVYMFHRHGDRTPKALAPANLTDLGYSQVYTSGDYYRNRYVDSEASSRILGINSDIVKQAQIAASSPADTVLQNSATGFLQGLYPPVGSALGTQTLRNGSNVTSPLNGYQLIPLALTTSGSGSEDNGWLQSASGCANAISSSNEYFSSPEYTDLLASTQDFYNSLTPVINATFSTSQISFKNAYTIYDLIHVAEIHNATINDSDVLTADVLGRLLDLANAHEWGLAYNSSNDMRAIAGKVLAAEIVQGLNTTISTQGKSKFNVQFGAYATFSSFFGLAGLPNVNSDFYGMVDYASSMTFELVTNASTSPFPAASDISVRFLFHNGTASADSEPIAYPLFGSGEEVIPWNDFVANMDKFSIGSTQAWCTACGNSTGTCAAYAPSSSSGSNNAGTQSKKTSGNGLSPVVNGVIGAMVTLAIVLGLEALVLLVGGMRVVSKKTLAARSVVTETVTGGKAA